MFAPDGSHVDGGIGEQSDIGVDFVAPAGGTYVVVATATEDNADYRFTSTEPAVTTEIMTLGATVSGIVDEPIPRPSPRWSPPAPQSPGRSLRVTVRSSTASTGPRGSG